MTSETPRTDALIAACKDRDADERDMVMRAGCRQLERELAEALRYEQANARERLAFLQRAERAESKLAAANAALEKINAIRNSIIGCQSVNWSAHIYPLVAALEAAGIKGDGYELSRKQEEANLAALQASPNVAGLVDAYDAARYRFEEWDGDVLIPEQNADLEWRVTGKNAARQRILDALLSLHSENATLRKHAEAMADAKHVYDWETHAAAYRADFPKEPDK